MENGRKRDGKRMEKGWKREGVVSNFPNYAYDLTDVFPLSLLHKLWLC